MIDPVVKRRTSRVAFYRVVDRKTERLLGEVGQHFGGTPHAGCWSAWGPDPFGEEAVGEIVPTRAEAVAILCDPFELRPFVAAKVCKVCRNQIPKPEVCPTAECETAAWAEVRARQEDPKAWEHYDWLVANQT